MAVLRIGQSCSAPALAALLHGFQGPHASICLHFDTVLLENLPCNEHIQICQGRTRAGMVTGCALGEAIVQR